MALEPGKIISYIHSFTQNGLKTVTFSEEMHILPYKTSNFYNKSLDTKLINAFNDKVIALNYSVKSFNGSKMIV